MSAPPAVAFCPHPPALVPALASAAAPELGEVRSACLAAVAQLAAVGAAGLVVVGAGSRTRAHPGSAVGSLHGFGIAARFALDPREPAGAEGEPAALPLSLTVAAWLLREAGWAADVVGLEVAAAEPPDRCAALGDEVRRAGDGGTALLVMGDGSARRSVAAPGYLDERAADVDRLWLAALHAADAEALAAMDADLAAALLVAGRPAWQVAAAAVRGDRYDGDVLVQADPYGVAYAVATWRRRPSSR